MLAAWLGLAAGGHAAGARPDKPNVVFILCDDLGYGDVKCNNPGVPQKNDVPVDLWKHAPGNAEGASRK